MCGSNFVRPSALRNLGSPGYRLPGGAKPRRIPSPGIASDRNEAGSNTIHFFLQIMEDYEANNSKLDIYVQQSILSAFTLTNLINDLLDLAKMETATFQLAIEQFNFPEVVAEAYQILLF